jgi:integrase
MKKGDREHRVPLADAALTIVEKMAAIRQSDFVFPGTRAARPIGTNAMAMTLRRMGRGDVTVHGFRSSFRDWAAERTGTALAFLPDVRDVAEMALSHAVGDEVEKAYLRSDLFEKRRQLADAWAKFCATPPSAGGVVPIRAPVASV